MIDAHIHLDQYDQIDERIKTWQEAGISGVVAVSTDLPSSYRTLELKQRFPSFVYAAIGFHPEQPLPHPQDWEEWVHLVQKERPQLGAIGEVGLPHYSADATTRYQNHCERFEQIVQIASSLSLPLALHAVYEGAQTALSILQKYAVKYAHFHWLKAEASIIKQIVRCGYYISVTPEVCYRERDRKLLSFVPIEQLLLETDGPWPFAGPFSGMETSPLLLKHSLQTVAVLYKQDVETVKTTIVSNTKRIYR
ncbi:tatD related DNase family protein [Anoxybacillus sp. B7M1]|uniref:TatD family hydrolase n=1 Tax=unclassified Anoxybacillus TaxID=2639704 RepID=UPI0005CD87F0|nr:MULTISPECIES: TatD family hydrolase [unclassified Anoxybacillus]ANB56998.1 tatD related DNase family protein [Anoxybacillus sp. B2M1]ANB65071.1 tatD related DNase family protein [Anoxybacillus sp. B7M1]